jgi:hypothetical protein
MNRCDKCQVPLEASPMLIMGFTVLFCRLCKRFCVEGDEHWIEGGAGIIARLFARATMIRQSYANGSHG